MHSVRILSILAAGIFAAAIPHNLIAQAPQSVPPISQIRVTGQAAVSSAPDEAVIELGVTTRGSTAQAAATENAGKVERVIAALKKELGGKGSIRTISYNLNPEYRQYRDNEPPTIEGYTAYNVVRVTTGDLTSVGRLIDMAVEAGATNAQRLDFRIHDENRANLEALSQATANAMTKAQAIATALKLRVARIILVEEGGTSTPYPVYAARADMAKTPIEPGSVDVQSSVTLTVEVAP